jgi:hypothetical protein
MGLDGASEKVMPLDGAVSTLDGGRESETEPGGDASIDFGANGLPDTRVGLDANMFADTIAVSEASVGPVDVPEQRDERTDNAVPVDRDAPSPDLVVVPDVPLTYLDAPSLSDLPAACSGAGCADSGDTAPSCSQRTYIDSAGVFVLASSTAGSNCGDRVIPCSTIGQGITVAKALGRTTVYVGAGTYSESISLVPGITVEGGWSALGATWTPICTNTADAVVVQSPSSNITVAAKDLGGQAQLVSLTVKSKATASASESLYGVFATGATTKLTLNDVKINVAGAGAGRDGKSGLSGSNGSSAGCADVGTGASGAAMGTPGSNGNPTGFGVDGYSPGDGVAGTNGQDGSNGPAGTAGTCVRSCGTCPSPSSSVCASAADSCGTDSVPGCAGHAGLGGEAGTGGGSSVALYVWGATVKVVGGSLRAGNGGNGGIAGRGGRGGIGQPGKDGKDAAVCYRCSITSRQTGSPSTTVYQCGNVAIGSGIGGVANGVGGGNGTDGGDGGSGAGGSSFAVYGGGQPTLDVSATTVVLPGQAGFGGGTASVGVAKAIGP